MNQWIQHRRVTSSPFDFLLRLPREVGNEIYCRYLNIPESHMVYPRTRPNPSLGLLKICRQMTNDLVPVLYDGCNFEISRHVRVSVSKE